eukprot:TRINITY_DN58306_c0_g1_i1.p1 TRINITY_DN58306_c0_g1~~TRINITY_DN58306_c0_g1_i1.p1  ORF type:complete len:228 (-),score=37.42 TRINITY_DN58306_c0_g1_i1:156-803(-)
MAERSTKKSATKVEEPLSTPVPAGLRGSMSSNSRKELRVAFDMIDIDGTGTLNRMQARNWLRCAGWCLSTEELDQMLSLSAVGLEVRRLIDGEFFPARVFEDRNDKALGAWKLDDLLEINAENQERENNSVKALQDAINVLASNRAKVSRERLLNLLETFHGIDEQDFNQVMREAGVGSHREFIDTDHLAERMLKRIVRKPERHELVDGPPPMAR